MTSRFSTLMALSPLDGRYAGKTRDLAEIMGEYGLIKARMTAMVEWVILLSETGLVARTLAAHEILALRDIGDIDPSGAEEVKLIETRGLGRHKRTNHDVKACELWLGDQFEKARFQDLVPWIHFGLTSEDVNNMAYALMLDTAMSRVMYPAIDTVIGRLDSLARQYAALPMLARTHGQPASPTTLGKEFAVFRERVKAQMRRLDSFRLKVKTNGATGNYNALVVAFPDVDWPARTELFVERINERHSTNFEVNHFTTQIEPHDTYAELFDILRLLNSIIIDMCQDGWRYVSDKWLVQAVAVGETGSSTMPHKVNPIDAENAKGNARTARGLLAVFSDSLPISHLQRDLSDSTMERNFGSALGYTLIALGSYATFLSKVSPNEKEIAKALAEHPEVITEAYQTLLRKHGFHDAYMTLKDFARGKEVTMESLHDFVRGLGVPKDLEEQLLSITPENYIGIAEQLAKRGS